MESIFNIINCYHNNSWDEFWVHFGDFLIDFKECNKNELRYNAIKDEPVYYNDLDEWKYAFIAACIQKLCEEYDIERPEWIFKDRYFLKDPYFSMNTKRDETRTLLIIESPAQFRTRNLFVFENVLDIV